ncbi:MAG TPA: hydrogenase maturation protease [Actinomycetota bacterium]|nr:hydrogenase maturation protease [Actinomycetota bacterium]
MPTVRVIGLGTPDAGDDAAGLLAVRAARDALAAVPGVDVVESAAPLDALDLLDEADAAVIVDAVRTSLGGREPGDLIRAEAGPDGLPAEVRSSLSSHGLGLAEAVGLAAALGSASRIVFLGIEVAEVAAGGGLTPAVARSVPELSARIVTEARALART